MAKEQLHEGARSAEEVVDWKAVKALAHGTGQNASIEFSSLVQKASPEQLIAVLHTTLDAERESDAVEALRCLLRSHDAGRYTLESMLPHLHEGMQSTSGRIRHLCCETLFIGVTNSSLMYVLANTTVASLSLPLLQCLAEDEDESVSAVAHSAFVSLCSSSFAHSVLHSDTIRYCVTVQHKCSTTVRARLLGSLVDVCSNSNAQAAAHAITQAGLLDSLSSLFRSSDTLAALSALESFAEGVETGAISLHAQSHLVQVARGVAADQSADSMLRSKAVVVCGRLLGSTVDSDESMQRKELYSCVEDIAAAVCSGDSHLNESGLEAVGHACNSFPALKTLCTFRAGELLNFTCNFALHKRWNVAYFALRMILRSAPADWSESLRATIFHAVAPNSPSSCVWFIIKQRGDTAADSRALAYDLLIEGVKYKWFAMEMLAHSDLIRAICSADWEEGDSMCRKRFAAVKALAEKVGLSDPRIAKAYYDGPFGTSGMTRGHNAAVDIADRTT